MPRADTGDRRAGAGPQPMVHPPWCDRTLCTAPAERPTEYRGAGAHDQSHWSAPIPLDNQTGAPRTLYRDFRGATAQLNQLANAPWVCATFLVITSDGQQLTVAATDATPILSRLAALLQEDALASETVQP